MRKKSFVLLFVLLFSCCFLISCKKDGFSLDAYADEVRQNIFQGNGENYSLKAYYGYVTDKPFSIKTENDRQYQLTFYLLSNYDTNATYNLEFNLNGKKYNGHFSYSNKKNGFCALFNIEKAYVSSLEVTVNCSSIREKITLSSVIPKDTISYKTALNKLYSQQKTYINGFFDGDKFNANLSVRIIVKDNKAYYFIGIKDRNNSLKAMLIDGNSGEVLAIREVF